MLFQSDSGTARAFSKANLLGQECETGPDGPVMSFNRILILPLPRLTAEEVLEGKRPQVPFGFTEGFKKAARENVGNQPKLDI